jgi:multiple sugar transport system ATP-binding protein
MKGGIIQQLAPPHEIYNRPVNKYVAGFIGSPEMNFFEGTIDGPEFVTQGVRIPLAGYEFQGTRTDGPAWFGIRPEHATAGEAALDLPFHAEALIDIVEPMGSDTLVWAKIAGLDFRVRMDGQANVREGDTITIGFDPARASLFDKTSELRL